MTQAGDRDVDRLGGMFLAAFPRSRDDRIVVPNERSEEGPAFDFGLMKSEIPRP